MGEKAVAAVAATSVVRYALYLVAVDRCRRDPDSRRHVVAFAKAVRPWVRRPP
jgi:hypothetical protein